MLKPGLLATEAEFKKLFVTPGKPKAPKNPERLHEMLKEVMIRNTRAVADVRLPHRIATQYRGPTERCGGGVVRAGVLVRSTELQNRRVNPPPSPLIADYSFISLESVTYRPSGTVTPITLNSQNWIPPSPALAGQPAWFTDRSGIISLQGGAVQSSSSGPGASTIGTLPRAARPARDVYTIVITSNGAYADLQIAASGQINVISPRPPAVSGNAFVSLDGISYRR